MPCGVGVNTPDEVKQNLTRTCIEVCSSLKKFKGINDDDDEDNFSKNIRAHTDMRDNYSPGWKFNHWELKVLYFKYKFFFL